MSGKESLRRLRALGYESIFTSLDTRDTEIWDTYPDNILGSVVATLKHASPLGNSFVVTQHETILTSILFVARIIEFIRSKGYSIVPMHECRDMESAYRVGCKRK